EERVGDQKYQSAWIVPERGHWIEIGVTKRETLAMKIDQGAKLPATTFLRATSPEYSSDTDIIRLFYPTKKIKLSSRTSPDTLVGRFVAAPVVEPEGSKVLLDAGLDIEDLTLAKQIIDHKVEELELVDDVIDPLVLNTIVMRDKTRNVILREDKARSTQEALTEIYKRLRPGTPVSDDRAATLFHERFFDENRYRLGKVGRFRLNRKLNQTVGEDSQTLQKEDIVNAIRYLLDRRAGRGHVDDIDHLGNRRVRTIDELVAEEVRRGFLRLKRAIMERISIEGKDPLQPKTLVNSKTVSSAVEYFFARGELSQLVDQTNPIAQLTHERRLSALGPGGLNRKRAGFEVRDVHPSHYGRICPIETPEGTNIGLISSLCTFAEVDEYGFITTPYRIVKDGRVTDDIAHLRANEEQDKVLAPAGLKLDGHNRIVGDKVLARLNGEFTIVNPKDVHFADVSPFQILGLSAGLIPFLEHDDANRALMGSNMQRQAVPLLITERATVITGIERVVAENSSMVVTAKRDGIVRNVTADQVVVDDDIYRLRKFTRLNERTCLNQRPIVKAGDKVKKGQVIADGPATNLGELALGKNILVAFMPWDGYNFEDAIIVSERLLKDDEYTSIHIEEFEIDTRETRLGREELTRDIPNVSERALRNLGEDGIIRVGTKVRSGDILVGKVAPKSKTELSPEEKLLHAIFGKMGEDVKNESLEVPSGVEGIVIDTRKFSRKLELTRTEKEDIKKHQRKIELEFSQNVRAVLDMLYERLKDRFGKDALPFQNLSFGSRGRVKDLQGAKEELDVKNFNFTTKKDLDDFYGLITDALVKCEKFENERDKKINYLTRGDELATGVLEMVKVYVATKRNLSVGDKMAGRHGNKGVVAKILPAEDMPYLADGTPVDIMLNPLGVPSRMNVGQILETHLGWAADVLGVRALTPVFEGATEEEITAMLKEAKLPEDGKTSLYDGRTGDPFDQKVTVGIIYIMKLHHLVDDKVHARATGPYSLITQQPLGGKARYGGQRFGEMEIWALEAYGAAATLQELLTVKSDDIDGRTKMYEAMIKGENILEPGTPMSFEVLTNEIKGLGLSLKLEKTKTI
ncbi:MAG: DNA-directed RNA polymerase subunit beta, partial [Planctomycetota bacterium]|nr:DNA-directed RNA polymerase subunit beta [Planctomycetota bacterium]